MVKGGHFKKGVRPFPYYGPLCSNFYTFYCYFKLKCLSNEKFIFIFMIRERNIGIIFILYTGTSFDQKYFDIAHYSRHLNPIAKKMNTSTNKICPCVCFSMMKALVGYKVSYILHEIFGQES